MLSPDGRVIMVSGASRGIGLAVARALYAKGYSLSLGARRREAIDTAVADIADDMADGIATGRIMTQAYDAKDEASNRDWVEATAARFGRIDGLVNNAGILIPTSIEDDTEEAYDEMWAVNVKGPLRLIRLTMPYLKDSGSGRVVNIASLSGKRVKNDQAGYPMSKFAVVALTQAVRRAGWDRGVRATAVCPGYVATDMTSDVESVAARDMIQPEDLAELVATVIALPNTASVAEVPVNCVLEDVF